VEHRNRSYALEEGKKKKKGESRRDFALMSPPRRKRKGGRFLSSCAVFLKRNSGIPRGKEIRVSPMPAHEVESHPLQLCGGGGRGREREESWIPVQFLNLELMTLFGGKGKEEANVVPS